MALSQLQCLDENHVNWRMSEGKPEFFYSEDQRLALEELISRGREAFTEYLSKHGIREFLSEPEVERLARTAEAYQPGTDNQRTEAGDEGGDGAVSLQYWPDRSENSIPDLDLGWPEAITYRGVTRVQVHAQPPMDGNIHIKEVVRKAISQAQKVIAVVMDVFTDVDIFRDLLDACYKRKVAVYIILDFAAVPCFLLMCERAGMHTGHLKHLRVRCSGGVDFYSRSAQKVCGSLSQRFLFLDGDKAISGSYSFTWSSSRLDRQLITAMSGQTVEAFDKLFRDLYLTSRSVSLSKVKMGEEPTPEPAPSAPAPAPPSAAVARKLINPKYALVTAHTSPASSGDLSSHKNSTSQNTVGLLVKGRVREPVEAPPLHPGLANLEKVYLVAYLPTWPEPDPAGDVIGFINVRGESRPIQTHLQRSQQFETSQAVRFSSPFSPPAPPQLPEVATPRKHTHTANTHTANTQTADTHTADTHTADTHTADTHTADTHINKEKLTTDTHDIQSSPNTHTTDTATHTESDIHTESDTHTTSPQASPIPKPRTMQLLINPTSSLRHGQQVTVVPRTDSQSGLLPASVSQSGSKSVSVSQLAAQKLHDSDGGLHDSDGGSSTRALCDQTVGHSASSVSTASDEYYECDEASEQACHGVTTGSGRDRLGHRHGEGVNMMARFSQSMLDLRPQSQHNSTVLHQSQQRTGQAPPLQYRHTGQLFQSSRSSGRDNRSRGGAKVVIAKPGSFHRPIRATGPVIGGHRYWHGQSLQPDRGWPLDTRGSRSPGRRSPASKRSGFSSDHTSPAQPANQTALECLSFSKLTSLKYLRGRDQGGASLKKTSLGNKEAS